MKSKEQLDVEEWRLLEEKPGNSEAKSFSPGRSIVSEYGIDVDKWQRREELSKKFHERYSAYKEFFKDEDESNSALGCL